jgi:hypothetical protein
MGMPAPSSSRASKVEGVRHLSVHGATSWRCSQATSSCRSWGQLVSEVHGMESSCLEHAPNSHHARVLLPGAAERLPVMHGLGLILMYA